MTARAYVASCWRADHYVSARDGRILCGSCAVDDWVGHDDHYYNGAKPEAVFDRARANGVHGPFPVPHWSDMDDPAPAGLCADCGEVVR